MKMQPTRYAVCYMLCSVILVKIAQAETALPYPDIVDTSHVTQAAAKLFAICLRTRVYTTP